MGKCQEQPAERSSGGNRWDQRRKGDRDKGSRFAERLVFRCVGLIGVYG